MTKPAQAHPGDQRLSAEQWAKQVNTLVKILKFAGNRIHCVRTRKMNRSGTGQAFAVLCVVRPHPLVAHEYKKPLRVQNISGLVSDVTGLKWMDEGAVSASSPYTINDLLERRLEVKLKVYISEALRQMTRHGFIEGEFD